MSETDYTDYAPITTRPLVEDIITPQQRERVLDMHRNWRSRETVLTVDSSLPEGYIAFRITAPAAHNSTTAIYGGIDPSGRAST
jgi:hypothetical protein